MKKTLVIACIAAGMFLVPSCKDPASPPSTPDTYASFKANGNSVNWTFAWADTENAGTISIHSGPKDTVNSNNLLNLNLIPKQTGTFTFDSLLAYNMFFTYYIGQTTQDDAGLYWSELSSSFFDVSASVTISKLENGYVEGVFSGRFQLTSGTGIGEYLTITDGKFRAKIRG